MASAAWWSLACFAMVAVVLLHTHSDVDAWSSSNQVEGHVIASMVLLFVWSGHRVHRDHSDKWLHPGVMSRCVSFGTISSPRSMWCAHLATLLSVRPGVTDVEILHASIINVLTDSAAGAPPPESAALHRLWCEFHVISWATQDSAWTALRSRTS